LQTFVEYHEDHVCQAEKKEVMPDAHVLVYSDFYPISALGDMWVKCVLSFFIALIVFLNIYLRFPPAFEHALF